MRILIEQSGYPLRNIGDLAMLQVTVQRLKQFWADADIQIFTTSPQKLTQYCPNTKSIKPLGRQLWFHPLSSQACKLLPNSQMAQAYQDWEWRLRLRSPAMVQRLLRAKLSRQPENVAAFEEFTEAIYQADLVIASGGGYMTDVFKDHAASIISTIGLAAKLGKPTALLGQGLGPLGDRQLLEKIKAVFPLVNLISLREKRAGLPLLNSMGISQDRILTTGDDAIELAYRAKSSQLGDGIGINLRVAKYSQFDDSLMNIIRDVLQTTAQQLRVPLVPVPISRNACGSELSDSMAIQQLMQGYGNSSDGGWSLDTPLKVIQQIGSCRVVVTGSYHAGVFALSQGIPVISLAKAPYYADKFLGLADQFGIGCEVLFLDDDQLPQKLSTAIHHAWQKAEQFSPQILNAAERQIDLGHIAYQKVYDLVNV